LTEYKLRLVKKMTEVEMNEVPDVVREEELLVELIASLSMLKYEREELVCRF
jgi:hypothetical protein